MEAEAAAAEPQSIMYRGAVESAPAPQTDVSGVPPFLRDLHLDEIIDGITTPKAEYALRAFLLSPLRNADAVHWRQDIMRDVRAPETLAGINHFADTMRKVRATLERAEKSSYELQRQRWYLGAAARYCETVRELARHLSEVSLASEGLTGFTQALVRYAQSASFRTLADEVEHVTGELAAIRYGVVIAGLTVEVCHVRDDSDYSKAIDATFERFSVTGDDRRKFSFADRPELNFVEAKILDGVAHLFPGPFAKLASFCGEHPEFIAPIIATFDREVQFYIAFLDYIEPLERGGLPFCFPTVTVASKNVDADDAFDVALAAQFSEGRRPEIVKNDFRLNGRERILVVSGPNQGGKTTFARMFGQMHYLACLGYPVPGSRARLFVFHELFTHFERAETVDNLHGKLEDDLLRMRDILDRATPDSIIILNEIFTSTSLRDAILLSERVAARIIALDALCVWVTFLVEVASLGDQTVSMVSTVSPDDLATRTYKIVRAPASGLAYATALAEKHRVTYDTLKVRLAR